MTPSVTIRLAITIQPTLGHRSTPDTVNGTAIFKGKMYPLESCQFFLRSPMQSGFCWFFSISVWGKSRFERWEKFLTSPR